MASKGNFSTQTFLNIVKEAIRGGVTTVQLREKELSAKEFYDLALSLKRLCDEKKIPLIINDRLDIALAIDAYGVHLGQDDLPLKEARKILRKKKIIGLSTKTKEQIDEAYKNGADYVGCGAIYKSHTKDSSVIGLDSFKNLCKHIKNEKYKLKTVAIGGINEDKIKDFKDIQTDALAFSSAIMQSKNPYKTCIKIKKELQTFIKTPIN